MSAELDANDRDTLVLRYLDDRNLREVGAELGISEDAARKRVDRALERLRTVLEHRSVFATTVLLATALLSSVVAVLSATALLDAAHEEHQTVAGILLARGAKADIKRRDGATPVSIPGERGFADLADEIEKHIKGG